MDVPFLISIDEGATYTGGYSAMRRKTPTTAPIPTTWIFMKWMSTLDGVATEPRSRGGALS